MLCKMCNKRELTEGRIRRRMPYCAKCHDIKYPKPVEKRRLYQRNDKARVKKLVFQHYGESCTYCGSKNRLQIDHKNGDGAKDRVNPSTWYRRITLTNYPDDIQVLCRQCNLAKQQMTDEQFKDWIAMMYHKFNPDISV